MVPPRSPEHLAFIRSLPCAVPGCGRTRGVQAAHAPGSRGMGQKRSDLDTLPLCFAHHEEQHRIGWPRFLQTHELDIQEILQTLREKPRLEVVSRFMQPYPRGIYDTLLFSLVGINVYQAVYRGQEFELLPVEAGLQASLECAFQVCGEYLRDCLMQRKAS